MFAIPASDRAEAIDQRVIEAEAVGSGEGD